MLKKLIAILLALTLIAALAACGGKPAEPSEEPPSAEPTADEEAVALETYSLIMQTLSAGPSERAEYDIDFKATTDMKFMGESSVFTFDGNIQMKSDGDELQYAMILDMGELGGVMEMYYDGQTLYSTLDGEEFEMDMTDLLNQIENSVNIPEFGKEAIKSCEIREAGGNTIADLTLDGVALMEYVKEVIGEEYAELGADIEISDIGISIVSDSSGQPVSMDMDMMMGMTIEEERLEIAMVYEYTFNKLGSGVEINMPI